MLRNEFTKRCLQETPAAPGTNHGDVQGHDCNYLDNQIETRGQWHWQPRPW